MIIIVLTILNIKFFDGIIDVVKLFRNFADY